MSGPAAKSLPAPGNQERPDFITFNLAMKTDRPVNLNLLAFSFPLAAIVSITHRITGVVLFVGLAFALYALDLALASPEIAAPSTSLPSLWVSLSARPHRRA